jgi:hypothetical protein
MSQAVRATEIVSSLFPEAVQQQLMEQVAQDDEYSGALKGPFGGEKHNNDMPESNFTIKPIADFFPSTTIMFGDIVGFTAWSSTRESYQVFILLETIYHAFDKIANQRRVLKVETIGDCYVAVAGLPVAPKSPQEPRRCYGTICSLVYPQVQLAGQTNGIYTWP